MGPTVLVVDDEAPIRNMLAYSLSRAEMQVQLAEDAEQAWRQLQSNDRPDLLLLDWMLPGTNGLELIRRLRTDSRLHDLRVIMLTARGNDSDRAEGLDAGADDYVVKPFSTRELISRVRAVLRRASPDTSAQSQDRCLRVGEIVLDPESHRVMAANQAVHLGPTEYRILEVFMRQPDRAWRRSQLIEAIWNNEQAVEERTVDVHIRRLRKALEASGLDHFVQTIRGHGYRFSAIV